MAAMPIPLAVREVMYQHRWDKVRGCRGGVGAQPDGAQAHFGGLGTQPQPWGAAPAGCTFAPAAACSITAAAAWPPLLAVPPARQRRVRALLLMLLL